MTRYRGRDESEGAPIIKIFLKKANTKETKKIQHTKFISKKYYITETNLPDTTKRVNEKRPAYEWRVKRKMTKVVMKS